MKKSLFLIHMPMAIAALVACSNDPHYTYPWFHKAENVKTLCDSFSRSYKGEFYAYSQDFDDINHFADSLWTGERNDSNSAPMIALNIGDYDNQHFTVQRFPLSLVGYALGDTPLGNALKGCPPCDLRFPYRFDGVEPYDAGPGAERVDAGLYVGEATASVTVDYDGQSHLVTLQFSAPIGYLFNSKTGPFAIHQFQLQLEKVTVDGTATGHLSADRFVAFLRLGDGGGTVTTTR